VHVIVNYYITISHSTSLSMSQRALLGINYLYKPAETGKTDVNNILRLFDKTQWKSALVKTTTRLRYDRRATSTRLSFDATRSRSAVESQK